MLNLKNELQTYNRLISQRTNRRDDLEMLCNLLIFLSNSYELPELVIPNQAIRIPEQKLIFLQAYKRGFTVSRLCKYIRNKEQCLIKLCQEIESLSFKC